MEFKKNKLKIFLFLVILIIYTIIMYNMLKMKKMNGLKIFALVLLSLSKFETMFGMEKNEIEDNTDEGDINKNCYLIDDLGNKITLNNDKDIKFKIYNKNLTKKNKIHFYTIEEEKKTKTLVSYQKEKNISCPIIFVEDTVLVSVKQNEITLKIALCNNPEKYTTDTIKCKLIAKIGEDSMNDNYILVDAENKKIEKNITNKKKVFGIKGKFKRSG